MQVDKSKSSLFLGAALILFGFVYLLDNVGIIYFADDILMSLLFLGGGAFLFIRFHRSKQFSVLIFASIVTFIGLAILIDSFRSVDDGLIGALLFWGMSSLFAYGYSRNTEKWGLIIPTGILFTLGLIVLIDDVFYFGDEFSGGVFFLGGGLTFTFLYLLRNERNKLDWAKIPALILIILSGIVFLNITDSLIANLLLPIALIIFGGYLVYNSSQGRTVKKI